MRLIDCFNDSFPNVCAWLFLFKKDEELRSKNLDIGTAVGFISPWFQLTICNEMQTSNPHVQCEIKYECGIKAFNSDAV